MASAYAASASSPPRHRDAAYSRSSQAAAAPAAHSNPAPQGTFLPGTKVQVGSHRVTIDKYLSSGGFAHVYVVRVPRGEQQQQHELAVLKRVAVPDKEQLASMRTEVETMKKLQGHRHVVTYMDSHASSLPGGGYEVFLLMEYCAAGGLIDFMNTRLQHRLTEPEILKIFADVAEGVACMHYLKPPLLHRDLKVENVLIAKGATAPVYKVCDFGSAARPRPAARTADEGRAIEEDVQKHTTMQYRSPEMVDVWRKQPIDEKADIWALGVLLYKLCYYTTPFEDVGQMAILNASFKYPAHPTFSSKIKLLIGEMLKEDPRHRPNIYQVIERTCAMRGVEVPIKDIYATRTQSEARRNEALPAPAAVPEPAVGLQKQAPQVQVQSIPDITPMRRGRPSASAAQAAAKPSPSPARGDPFAALDSKNYDTRAGAVDHLSKRFPSLDEFSITHDKGGTFDMPQQQQQQQTEAKPSNVSERVTQALADEVFGQSKAKEETAKTQSTGRQQAQAQAQAQPRTIPTKSLSVRAPGSELSRSAPQAREAAPPRHGITYTDTAVGTSPPPSATRRAFPEISNRPIWKVPGNDRSASQPRASEDAQAATASLQPSIPPTQRTGLLDVHRSHSQSAQHTLHSSNSSRPSLEGARPSAAELGHAEITRTKSAQSRSRPSSVYVTSNLEYLRDQETARKRPSMDSRRHSKPMPYESGTGTEDTNIADDVDYLRNSEEQDMHSRKSSGHRHSGHHSKRSSLAHAKNKLAGRFGDARKRFEGHHNSTDEEARYESTYDPPDTEDEPAMLSPVLGLDATASRRSDADSAIDETEDLPPDVKRELERRKLSQEEKRVAEAAAEHRARVGTQGTGGAAGLNRASTIQKRVQSLLDEGRQSPAPHKRTAEGYGRYTDAPHDVDATNPATDVPPSPSKAKPPVAKKPVATPEMPGGQFMKLRQQVTEPVSNPAATAAAAVPPSQLPSIPPQQRVASRPSVPTKAQALRTGSSTSAGPTPTTTTTPTITAARAQWPPDASAQVATYTDPPLPPKPSGAGAGSNLAALLAKDLEGVPDYPPRGSSMLASNAAAAAAAGGSSVQMASSKGGPAASGALPRHGVVDARERTNGQPAALPSNTAAAQQQLRRAETSAGVVGRGGGGDDEVVDLEADFSKRYPSLSGIEMVEREIGAGSGGGESRQR